MSYLSRACRPGPSATLGLALALVATACSTQGTDPEAARTRTTVESGSPEPSGDTSATPTSSPTRSPSPSESTPQPSATPSSTDDPNLPPAPPIVRGVYSHVYTFWADKWFHLVDLVETTELNAVVVDVKDEAGTLLWDIDHPLAKVGGGGGWRVNYDGLEERLQALEDAGGWAIARVACFKDTNVAKARPEMAVQYASGGTWIAAEGTAWLNPYSDKAKQWCIDVGLAAIELGFDEVQFDYMRFPNGGDGDTSNIVFPGAPPDRPEEAIRHSDEITEFIRMAADQIHDAGGYVSADLFGLVTYDFRWNGGGTGQVLERIAQYADYISLMVYPSHYAAGNYGLEPHPIEYPFETVWNAMQEATMRTQGLHAELRPWLEDFDAPWMGYPDHSPQHVTAQMDAVYQNGIEGWLLWNAANTYTESILDAGETESKADPDFEPPARTANPGAPPGDPTEREWPGMPPCDPYPGVLQIGNENLAGSTPPEEALPFDDPRLCAGVPDGEEADVPWQQRQDGAGADDTDKDTDPAGDASTEPTGAGSASET